ncbi:MAG: aminotransferase class I/II-fold pyridoxal phosphate-dependent enzyme [Bacteriovoracaceae bacterium]|nr:aminotransferase class I/II-fold pyridoxal phosphate-dependent enzyme [Bacteriovoracaceae bacterium]
MMMSIATSKDFTSERVKHTKQSITLELNEKVKSLAAEGQTTFNLTAGQLPFRPPTSFIQSIGSQLNFLNSFQYSPVSGFEELRKKVLTNFFLERPFLTGDAQEDKQWSSDIESDMSCIVSNGSKHSLYNLLGCIVDPGDEVILFSPYWVSFPEMIKFWEGIPVVVNGHLYDGFIPDLEQLKKVLSQRTKAIILNSPNNPSGVYFSKSWMRQFATLLEQYPNVFIISDEIYSQLFYYDPSPHYFYQFAPSLLKRTAVVQGISKTLASTGLRIGYTVAPKAIIQAMSKLQGQTTSGPNSLIQQALIDFNDVETHQYLKEVRGHLRRNCETLKEIFRQFNLSPCWYQTNAAYYFLLDFMRTPYFKRKYPDHTRDNDVAQQICDEIFQTTNVAIVPGTNFGLPNSARISLTLEWEPFDQAIQLLGKFLTN